MHPKPGRDKLAGQLPASRARETCTPAQCVVVLLLGLTGLRGRGRVAGEPAACRKTVPAKSFEPKIGTAFWDHFRAPSIKALVTGLEKGLKNRP